MTESLEPQIQRVSRVGPNPTEHWFCAPCVQYHCGPYSLFTSRFTTTWLCSVSCLGLSKLCILSPRTRWFHLIWIRSPRGSSPQLRIQRAGCPGWRCGSTFPGALQSTKEPGGVGTQPSLTKARWRPHVISWKPLSEESTGGQEDPICSSSVGSD